MGNGDENTPLHVSEPATENGRDYAERALQTFLEGNLSRLGIPSAQLLKSEHQTEVGRIDLLIESGGGSLWVVELKAGVAGRDAIGQVISYMGAIRQANPDKQVYGMLVAPDFDKGCIAAHSATINLELKRVRIEYLIEQALPMNTPHNVLGRAFIVGDNMVRCSSCGLERKISPDAQAFVCSGCKAYNQI